MASTDPDYDLVIGAFTAICSRLDTVGFDNLTENERIVYCTWQFVTEVNNGGFRQFFTNPSGEFAEATVDALESVGMPYAASLLRRALTVFPNPAKDHASRDRQVRSLPLEVQWEMTHILTDSFFSSFEDPYALQSQYIQRHRDNICQW